jgi:aminopeptidase 2
VQHELAHICFGNLVTMDFWDGLWLKEGFAALVCLTNEQMSIAKLPSRMSWYSTNTFYPEWHVWQGYITDTLDTALQ